MNKNLKIAAIGTNFSSNRVASLDEYSRASLLDFEIIIFRPLFPLGESSYYLGKPALSEGESFIYRENCEFWQKALSDAVSAGKLVIVFLCEINDFFIDTGKREYSGTGRNRQSTRLVDKYTNYRSIPFFTRCESIHGKNMELTPEGRDILVDYWTATKDFCEYRVTLSDAVKNPLIVTPSGKKRLSFLRHDDDTNGKFLFLPDLQFEQRSFFRNVNGKYKQTPEGERFEHIVLDAIIDVGKRLSQQAGGAPAPAWASSADFILKEETSVLERIEVSESQLQEIQSELSVLHDDLKRASQLKALLYESGKPLEHAIIKALRILGYEAEGFNDGDSEFDAIFHADGVRLIGEAEGKENSQISIGKFRQLSLNIQEDFQKDGVEEMAKGILFGNAFRFKDPKERGQQFTEKCIKMAESTSCGLIATSELFLAVKYIQDYSDTVYAENCRKALKEGIGVISFPERHFESRTVTLSKTP